MHLFLVFTVSILHKELLNLLQFTIIRNTFVKKYDTINIAMKYVHVVIDDLRGRIKCQNVKQPTSSMLGEIFLSSP